MKLPEEVKAALRIKPEDHPNISLIDLLSEAIVRDCAKAYDEWRQLNHQVVGDFPRFLCDRYSLEPRHER